MGNKSLKNDTQIKRAIKDVIQSNKTTSYAIEGHTGLELRIRPHQDGKNVTCDFRHRYTHPITGKRPYMTLGQYPAFKLADAHNYYKNNRTLLQKNIDPIEHRDVSLREEQDKRQNILQTYIDEWHQLQKDKNLSKTRYINIENNLEPIITHLGHLPVTNITPLMIIDLIEPIQKTHTYRASRIRATLKAVLQRALIKRAITTNPASDLQDIFVPHNVKHYAALTEPNEFSEVLKDIANLPQTDQNYNKEILQLLALTFVRVGDICSMKWNDVYFDARQWRFKQAKARGRNDMMPEIVVPLAPQTLSILKSLYKKTGDKEYVFYNSRRKLADHASPQEISKLLKQPFMNRKGIGAKYNFNGYDQVHSPHGFRASAKSILKRLLRKNVLWRDMTELQLGHTTKDNFGNAYDRWDLIEERTKMMNEWANYLDDLRAGKLDNVIHANFKQANQIKNV